MSATHFMLKIHERAVAAAETYHRAEAELIEALISVERERVFMKLGFSSLYTYTIGALKLPEAVAYNFITVSRKACEVPEVRREIAAGSLSVTKARKMSSVIRPDNALEWVEKAKTLSTRALEKEVARVNPKKLTPEQATYVTGTRIRLTLGLEEKAMLELRRAQDQVSRSQQRAASLEDTLAEVLRFYLKHKDPVERAKRVIAKRGSQPNPSVSLKTLVTGRVHARTPIPASVQHQVRLRDGGKCQAPACTERRWTDLHHVKPVAEGGRNVVANLITLCKTHHRQSHLEPA